MGSKRKLCFLVDYCIVGEVFDYLRDLQRVRVISFKNAGLTQRSSDEQVLEKATAEGALVLTADKRFTEKHRTICTHEGIIKFDVRNPRAKLRLLKDFLRTYERHLAWKSVVHLHENQIVMHGHDGQLSVNYHR